MASSQTVLHIVKAGEDNGTMRASSLVIHTRTASQLIRTL